MDVASAGPTERSVVAVVKNRLSDREVRARLSRKTPGMTNNGGGLYLRIRDSGRGEWLFRYRETVGVINRTT